MNSKLIETSLASKYHAIYIVQFFAGTNKYISSSSITRLINKKIEEKIDSIDGMSLVASLNIPNNPNIIYNRYKNMEITSWDDIISIYSALAIISEMTSRKDDTYIHLLNDMIEICASESISNWINENGGWDGFKDLYFNNKSTYKNYLFGIGILSGIIGVSTYLLKKR
jgi:hypothetical protein